MKYAPRLFVLAALLFGAMVLSTGSSAQVPPSEECFGCLDEYRLNLAACQQFRGSSQAACRVEALLDFGECLERNECLLVPLPSPPPPFDSK
jgi:hypothetical protein